MRIFFNSGSPSPYLFHTVKGRITEGKMDVENEHRDRIRKADPDFHRNEKRKQVGR